MVKTDYIGFRLGEETMEKLSKIAAKENISAGKMAKRLLIQVCNLRSLTPTDEYVKFSINTIKVLLSYIPPKIFKDKVEEYVKSTIFNIKFAYGKDVNYENLDDFMNFVNEYVGPKGMKWFTDYELKREDNTMQFRGIHNLGIGFSHFYINSANLFMKMEFDAEVIPNSIEFSDNYVTAKYELDPNFLSKI